MLRAFQALKKSPHFNVTLRILTVFTRVHSILILSSNLHLCLKNGLYYSEFSSKNFEALLYLTFVLHDPNQTLLDLIMLIVFGEKDKL
jgi:hypothetical protein